VIAVDTNVLIHAHREESEWHEMAARRITELAEGSAPWLIPWPCVHEFLAVTTNTRLFKPPTPLERAISQVDAWMESPSLTVRGEEEGHWPMLCDSLRSGKVTGGAIHDARIVAVCREHGVTVLWTADRDFSRFAGLRVENPLVEA
jgi:toxin-antitoxin system PIN domain toxin